MQVRADDRVGELAHAGEPEGQLFALQAVALFRFHARNGVLHAARLVTVGGNESLVSRRVLDPANEASQQPKRQGGHRRAGGGLGREPLRDASSREVR
ncbi:hypothetical protein D3C87_1488810 [compost metagenome]